MYIHNYGIFVGRPVDDMKFYKNEVNRYTQLHFRRANHFVLLSLAGACRCAHEQGLKKSAAVYLTTENGNLGDTETVLAQIFHQHQFPMPYNFINTMSNTASFYVAQSLDLFGRNVTFSSKQISFERGLELLRSDLRCGAVEEALIGGVDEACFSKQQFEAKYSCSYEKYEMVEGSCWLLVKTDAENAIGEIRSIESFSDLSGTLGWIAQQSFSRPLITAFGIRVNQSERQVVSDALPTADTFDYIAALGYHDSATASGVTSFLESPDAGRLLHINKDFRGHFVVLAIDKFERR